MLGISGGPPLETAIDTAKADFVAWAASRPDGAVTSYDEKTKKFND